MCAVVGGGGFGACVAVVYGVIDVVFPATTTTAASTPIRHALSHALPHSYVHTPFAAYRKDVGSLSVLAPDTDVEDMGEVGEPEGPKAASASGGSGAPAPVGQPNAQPAPGPAQSAAAASTAEGEGEGEEDAPEESARKRVALDVGAQ